MSVAGISQLLDHFEGQWQLSRSIAEEGATMRGSARFVRAADGGLLYDEEGMLMLGNGQSIRCTRRYKFLADGEKLTILFNDGQDAGKPFVELKFGDEASGILTAVDKHYCGQDVYSVAYRLNLPVSYETDVSVAGPKKHYRALTRYTKVTTKVTDQASVAGR